MTIEKSGIYIVTNTQTGGTYIGASSNLNSRKYHHLRQLHLGDHHSKDMLNDYQSSGMGNTAIEFSVLEYCPPASLIDREKAHISALKPSYNSNGGGGGIHAVTDDFREKQRQRWTGKQMRKVGYFVTPWGTFESGNAASDACTTMISQAAVWQVCTKPERVISRQAFSKSRYLQDTFGESVVGKSWADLGFGFIPSAKEMVSEIDTNLQELKACSTEISNVIASSKERPN